MFPILVCFVVFNTLRAVEIKRIHCHFINKAVRLHMDKCNIENKRSGIKKYVAKKLNFIEQEIETNESS
jgi:hypothetical protein